MWGLRPPFSYFRFSDSLGKSEIGNHAKEEEMTVDEKIMNIMTSTATPIMYHPDDDKPTDITRDDINRCVEDCVNRWNHGYFDHKLLESNIPPLLKERHMEAIGGRTLRFRRYEPLDTQAVPLGNGYPVPQQLRAVDYDVDISELAGLNDELLGSAIDLDSGASGISLGALSSSGEDSAFSRQQQRVQFPSGSPGFTENMLEVAI